MSGRVALKDALGKLAERVVERNRTTRRATVVKLNPLTVDVFGYDVPLTVDDDFELSQSMVAYQQSTGLAIGDMVFMHQEGHDWTLVDAVSDRPQSVPVGSANAVVHQPGDLVPSAAVSRPGCLLCDGSGYSRTAYPALYAALDPVYHIDADHFRVPDLKGRAPIGTGSGTYAGTITPRAQGDLGGVEGVTLAAAESGVNGNGATNSQLGTHSHYTNGTTNACDRDINHLHGGPNDGASTVYMAAGGPATGQGVTSSAGQTVRAAATTTGACDRSIDHLHAYGAWSNATYDPNLAHAHALNARAADNAHNNMQPFAVVNWFVKT